MGGTGARASIRPTAAALLLVAWLGVPAAGPASPDPERAFADRHMQPVVAWLEGATGPDADTMAALRARAWLARRAGDRERAMALIDRAVQRWPDVADLRVDRAAFRSDALDGAGAMTRMRIARDVRRDLERAVESDPEHVDALVGLIAFHRQAPGIVGGRDRRADELMRRLATISPSHHDFRVAMRRADDERFAEAAAAMARALETAEHPPLEWRLREAEWLRRAGARAGARERLLGLLARAPDYGPALFEAGLLAGEGGLALRVGIDALRRYVSLPAWPGDPSLALAWTQQARLYDRSGAAEAARAALARALRLDPALESARDALKRLGGTPPADVAAD